MIDLGKGGFCRSRGVTGFLFLFLLFSSQMLFAAPPPINHSEPELLWPDTAQIVIETDPGVRSVRFYFLRPGFDQYQMRFMKPQGDGSFVYQFDTSTLESPILYYYFEVRTAEGNVYPYPADAPLTPMMIEDDREGIELDLTEVSAVMDEEEAASTGSITVNGTLEYSVSRDRTVEDTSTDAEDDEGWESSEDTEEETEDTSRFADDDFLADFNIRLAKTWEKGETSISFDTNLTYTSHPLDEEKEGGISSILLEVKRQHHQLRIGDLEIVGTELVGDSLYTRGTGYQYSRGRFTSELYYMNSRQSTIVEDSVPDADNYVAGAKLGVDVIEDYFHIDLHYFKGNDDSSIATYSSGYETEILEGELFSIAPRISFFDQALSFVGEYAETRSSKEMVPSEDEEEDDYSYYGFEEEETEEETGELKDSAWRIGAEVEKGPWKVSAFHKYIGPDFRSLFNLNETYFAIDRRGYELNLEYFSEKFDVLVLWEDLEDNLDDDADREWSRYQTVSITPVWRVTDSLSLSVGHTNGQERSYEDEDRKTRLTDQDIVGYSAGIDYTFTDSSAVQLAWNIDESESADTPEYDSVTNTVTLNFSYYDERLQFYPGVSYSQTDTEEELTETLNVFISGEYFIISDYLSVSTNDSFTWTKGEETARTRMMLLTTNINWHLSWIHGAFSDTVFAIVGEYTEDQQEDSTTESYSVSTKLDFMF